ncbi:hypothetical protein NL676_003065 [Syzygium grande]|nr:hypothetical protein NL676_003065 [Syzygium grande]
MDDVSALKVDKSRLRIDVGTRLPKLVHPKSIPHHHREASVMRFIMTVTFAVSYSKTPWAYWSTVPARGGK